MWKAIQTSREVDSEASKARYVVKKMKMRAAVAH